MDSNQPAGMTNDQGILLTVGASVNGDDMAIVLPLCTDYTPATDTSIAEDAVESFAAASISLLQACMSNDSYITFVAAESMIDGQLPYRADYDDTTYPGMGATGAAPSQVCGLVAFYQDPNDVLANAKIRVGKTFMFATPSSEISGDELSDAQVAAINAWASPVQQGIPSLAVGGSYFYRILAAPRTRATGQAINRTINAVVRGYVATQRRRLIPR